MRIVVTGSIAFDYIMSFPGRFKDHILPDKIHMLSVSFLVDSMRKERGGCAPNIAYSLALLGERPTVMGTVGQDFSDYRAWLERNGVDTSLIREVPDLFTASFFVSTDQDNNQIASFYTGAMARARDLSFHEVGAPKPALAVISPNDPVAMTQYAQECKALGIPYIYDPSQQIIRLSPDELVESAQGAKVLIVNDYELEMFKNKTHLTDEEVQGLADILIVTCGEDGSVIWADGRRVEVPAVCPSTLCEPTGVGDAYRAGIIKGMLRGYSWETTGRIASLAATYVLEKHGTQNHHYTRDEFVARYRQTFGDAPELDDLLGDSR
ncbi:MAG: carbohydrate kinase family protein [Anaerolineae bacterium]|nr:carbohydrate kinase family protein [Anaerolineae bacterium]